jgi:hypothetical protein
MARALASGSSAESSRAMEVTTAAPRSVEMLGEAGGDRIREVVH